MSKQWKNRISAWIVTTVVAQCFAATALAGSFNFHYQMPEGVMKDYPGLRDCSADEQRAINTAYEHLLELIARGLEEQKADADAPWGNVDFQRYFVRHRMELWEAFSQDPSVFDQVPGFHQHFTTTLERMGDLLASAPAHIVAKCTSLNSKDLGIRPRDLPHTIIYDTRSLHPHLSVPGRTKAMIANTVFGYFQLFIRPGERINFSTDPRGACYSTLLNTLYHEYQTLYSINSPINYSAYLGALYEQEIGRDNHCSATAGFDDDIVYPIDSDGDGVFDRVDNCPYTSNPAQKAPSCETERERLDSDGDGVLDRGDEGDNCPNTFNPGQDDIDMDGIGYVCDSVFSAEAEQRRSPRTHAWNQDQDKNFSGELASCSGDEWDFLPVEDYLSVENVNLRQSSVGQLQWNEKLIDPNNLLGDVANERFCTGTQISFNLFLTAAHCLEVHEDLSFLNDESTSPVYSIGEVPKEIILAATNLHVNFLFQEDRDGSLRDEEKIPVVDVLEYSKFYDYAILKLDSVPRAAATGFPLITPKLPAYEEQLTIIQHPEGELKVFDSGKHDGIEDTSFFSFLFNGYMRHLVDTLPGSSGSGILNEYGELVGIHTNGGCSHGTGANHGEYIATLIGISPILQGYNKDSDRDFYPDLYDNCPFVANAGQSDKDGDGVGNRCDDDVDGDGIFNELDNCKWTPNAEQWDKDKDGIGNDCDTDIDGDGIANTLDNCMWKANPGQWDKDKDGFGNACDWDIDGDGFTNKEERAAGSKPWNADSTPLNP